MTAPPKRVHATQPESKRAARQVMLRLTPETRAQLAALAAAWGTTRSEAVTRLVTKCVGCSRTRHVVVHGQDVRLLESGAPGVEVQWRTLRVGSGEPEDGEGA